MRNVMVCFGNGENVLVYSHDDLSNEAIMEIGKKAVGDVSDVYDVKTEELQYYIIDGRCWYDTKERANKVLSHWHLPQI